MEGVENALASGLSVLCALLQRAADATNGASSLYAISHAGLSSVLPAWLQLRFWEQSQLQGHPAQQQDQPQPPPNRAAASMVAKVVFSAGVIYVTLIVLFELLSSLCRRAARRSALFNRSAHPPHELQTRPEQGDPDRKRRLREEVSQGLGETKTTETLKSAAAASPGAVQPTTGVLLAGDKERGKHTSEGKLQGQQAQCKGNISRDCFCFAAAPTAATKERCAADCRSSHTSSAAAATCGSNLGSCPTTQPAQLLQQDETAHEPVLLLHAPKWFLLTTFVSMLFCSTSGYVALTALILLWRDDPSMFAHVLRPTSTYKPLSAAILCLAALASTLQLFKGLLGGVTALWTAFSGGAKRRNSSPSSSSRPGDKSSNCYDSSSNVDTPPHTQNSSPTLNNSDNSTRQPPASQRSSSPSCLKQLHRVYPPLFFTGCLAKGVPFTHALIIVYLFGFALKQLSRSVALLSQLYNRSTATVFPPVHVTAAAASAQQQQHPQPHQHQTGFRQEEKGKVVQVCTEVERLRALLQPLVATLITVTALYHPLLQQLPGSSRAVLFAKICIYVEVLSASFACASVIKKYFKQLRPSMFTFLLLFHIFAAVGLLLLLTHPLRWRLFFEVYGLYVVTGLGITCGAHRLWAHRSYKAGLPYRCVMLLLNSVANQGSIYHWARDHRVHHKHSDTKADPYNATRGFFYSHVGWLLLKKPDAVKLAGQDIDCNDLLVDGCVSLQRKLDPWWNQFFCFVLPSLYGYYAHDNFWLGFFVHGALRWCVTLHATWTVNSVAHFWGDRPYRPGIRPRESPFTAFVANGEGWHNWHHLYPFDYATSEGGFFQYYNPSKLVIDTAARFGLVWDRRRATGAWQRVLLRREEQRKQDQQRLQQQESGTASLQQLTEKQQLRLLECMRSAIPAAACRIHTLRNLAALTRDLLLLFGSYWLLLRLDTGLFLPPSPPSASSSSAVVPASQLVGAASAATSGEVASAGAAAAVPAASAAATETAETFAAHAAAFPFSFSQGVEFLLLLLLRGCFVCVSGSVAFVLFLHATRAAQGKLCASPAANDVLAFLLHGLLLAPYKSRRLGRPCAAPATRTALYSCCFRLLLLAAGSSNQRSFLCCLSLACGYGYAAASLGFYKEVLVLVLLPYIYCNCIMGYVYGSLQCAAPHDSLNDNDDLRHPSPEALEWLLSARREENEQQLGQQQQQQKSRSSKRLRLLHCSVLQTLRDRHLVEALTFEVSPQGLDEAAGIVRELLDFLAAAAARGASVDFFIAAAAKVACRAKQQQKLQHEDSEEEEDEDVAAAAAAAAKGVACCPAASVNKKLVAYAVHEALNQEDAAAAAANLLHPTASAAATTPCARKVAAAAAKAFGS